MSRSILAAVGLVSALAAGVQPSQAQTASTRTRNFVQNAAQSDQFEILEGETTLGQSGDPRVRAFAKEMISAHHATTQALAQATAADGAEPPPPGLGGDQQKLLGTLQSLRGRDFDRTYAHQQVLAHVEALLVEQTYAADGPQPDIRQAARSAVPIIQRHLEMARRLQGELGGE